MLRMKMSISGQPVRNAADGEDGGLQPPPHSSTFQHLLPALNRIMVQRRI